MKKYKIGIIGAGLQASRRIPAILDDQQSEIMGITAKSDIRLQTLANKYSIRVYDKWQEMLNNPEINIIIVTTYPDSHAKMTLESFKKGKHVLCEKPLAKTSEEVVQMIQTARKYKKILKCGFNHRFHPALWEAKKIIDTRQLGSLLFGRGIYGYCGRPGFEKEWRANKKYVSGGILMEQGIHLVDLFRWYFGNFSQVQSICETSYWPIQPLEDNAFVFLKTETGQTISIHTTNLQWRNTFHLEIYGTLGYLKIEGLGASYGTEKLTVAKKDYRGPFKESVTEYRGGDSSWKSEWLEFTEAIKNRRQPIGNGEDGLAAIQIVEKAYLANKKQTIVSI